MNVTKEDEANAKLIAAAPELLKRLEANLKLLYELRQFYINETNSFDSTSDEYRMALQNVKDTEKEMRETEAAIKKATE